MADNGQTRVVTVLVLLVVALVLGGLAVTSVSGATWRLSERKSGEVAAERQLDSLAAPGRLHADFTIDADAIRAALEVSPELAEAPDPGDLNNSAGDVTAATPEVPGIIGEQWVYVGNSFAFNDPYGIFMDSRNGVNVRARVGETMGDVLLSALAPDAATITREDQWRRLALMDLNELEVSKAGAGSAEEYANMMAKYWDKIRQRNTGVHEPLPGERMPPFNAPTAEEVALGLEEYKEKYGKDYQDRHGDWQPQDGLLNPADYADAYYRNRDANIQRYMREHVPDGVPDEGDELQPGEYVKDENGTRYIRVNTFRRGSSEQ